MKHEGDDERARRPVVQASYQGAEADLRLDEADRLPRALARGRVIDREQDSRSDLQGEQEENDASEYPRPSDSFGDLLLEKPAHRARERLEGTAPLKEIAKAQGRSPASIRTHPTPTAQTVPERGADFAEEGWPSRGSRWSRGERAA